MQYCPCKGNDLNCNFQNNGIRQLYAWVKLMENFNQNNLKYLKNIYKIFIETGKNILQTLENIAEIFWKYFWNTKYF